MAIRINRKLISSPQFVAVLVGLIVGVFACFLVVYRGTNDQESLQRNAQNWGAEYRATWGDSPGVAPGVMTRLGVPVWDGAQGMGHRMPNLFSQETQSPFIFLRSIMPVENILIFRLFLETIIALILINLCVSSWGGRMVVQRLLLLDFAFLGQFIFFTAVTDWFGNAESYWGTALIVAGLCHASLYKSGSFNERKSMAFKLSIIFGMSFLFGPVGLVPLLVVGLGLAIPATKKIINQFKYLTLVLLVLVAMFPTLLNLFELASQVWPVKTTYLTHISRFDLFQATSVHRFHMVLALAISGFQPILLLIGLAGERSEFFNLTAVLLLIFAKYRGLFPAQAQKKLLNRCLLTILTFFLLMLFSGGIALAKIPLISRLMSIHGWMLSHPMLVVVTICSVILLGHLPSANTLKIQSFAFGLKGLVCLAALMAILYPVVMYTESTGQTDFAIFRDRQVNDESVSAIQQLDLERLQRFIILKPFYKDDVLSFLGNDVGIRFDLQIARAGFPTVDQISYGRSMRTLVTPKQQFRSMFIATTEYCSPKALDFIGVSTIWVEQVSGENSASCAKLISNYFRVKSSLQIGSGEKLRGLKFKPKVFSSFSHGRDFGSQESEPCPQFEKDCLTGLTATKISGSNGSPFQLCQQECLFTYQWAAPSSSTSLVIPNNYDKTFVVRDRATGIEVQTSNFRGLLSVKIPSGQTSGVFEASIRSDGMMWARVVATYFRTIVFLGCLLALLLSGIRGLKDFEQLTHTGDRD